VDVLIASDSAATRTQVREGVPDPAASVREVSRGVEVLPAVREQAPDLLVVDLQMGRMGGMAVCLDLHLEHGAGNLPRVPIVMLLDRRADVFLARRSHADGWVIKPFDPIRLRRALSAVLAGERFEDPSYEPVTVPLPATADLGAATDAAS
jgi:DNA-binding response OmpR family regulator